MRCGFVVALGLLVAACDSLPTSLAAGRAYVARAPTRASSTVPLQGGSINVVNENGSIEIVGVPHSTRIEVDAYPSATADDQVDADAAMADVAAGIAVVSASVGGTITFTAACRHALADHGSATRSGTGCERLVVRVPAGTEAQPVALSAFSSFGGVKIEGVTGSVTAEASFDVHVAMTPTKDAKVSVVNGNDGTNRVYPVVLVVPQTFSTASLLVETHLANLSASRSRVVTDFPDLATTTCDVLTTNFAIYPGPGPFACITDPASHGKGPARAAWIEVLAGQGDAYFLHDPSLAPVYGGGR